VPVVGDWDGNGTTTNGVFEPTTMTWYLKNSNGPGAPDIAPFRFGAPGWLPVVGDWDGNGTTTIGVVDPATMTWYLKDSNGPGAPDIAPFRYGAPGWVPVAGDWDGNGTTTAGVFDPGSATWYLRDRNSPGAPDLAPFRYGAGAWEPVASSGNFVATGGGPGSGPSTPPPADTTPPSVTLTAPAAGAVVAGSVTVTAGAADNVGVAGVQFLLDGQPLGAEDTAAPYAFSWNTAGAANGPHTLAARARDAAGNTATSAAVTVTVANNTSGGPQPFPNNGNPPALPAPTGTVINVSTVSQLQSAVANLQSGQTILIAPGTYNLTGTLYVPQGLSDIAIRGVTGNAADVVIQGDAVLDVSAPYSGSAIWGPGSGISGTIPFGIWLGNVQRPTIADLTLQEFVYHAIILNAGVQAPLIHDVVMLDAGEQLLKSNPNGSGGGVNNGVVEYCTIGFSTAAPNNYTNGVDLLPGQNWTIRNNLFENILTTNPKTTVGPGTVVGPAVLVWGGSKNCTTVANTFVNCQREISYGLSDPSSITDDNTGGLIANNFIYRSGTQHGDVGIGVWNSPGTVVADNTVILNGDYVNAVEYRFATTTGVVIENNLTDAAITARDGATGTVTNNLTNAQASWFVNESVGNLHLVPTATAAIDHGLALASVTTDYDGQTRPSGAAPDIGADEYVP
jgi:hypothetical protein